MRMLKDVVEDAIRADLSHATTHYRICLIRSGEGCYSLGHGARKQKGHTVRAWPCLFR